MEISKETQEKIDFLFKKNPLMKEKLLNCDPNAIREIGSISQRGMNPDDIIAAYESNDPNTMEYLYNQAQKMVKLKELYRELCLEYCKKVKDEPKTEEQLNVKRKI